MKYTKSGNFVTNCELVSHNADGTVTIKYTELFEGEIEKDVKIEDVELEMEDTFDHVIDITTAEKYVVFKEPIKVGFFDRVTDNVGSWIEYEYDFGMSCRYSFEPYKMLGIDPDWSDEDVVRRLVEFDLAHAFDHPQEDPNYNHTHWALYGNLKDRFQEVLDPENH